VQKTTDKSKNLNCNLAIIGTYCTMEYICTSECETAQTSKSLKNKTVMHTTITDITVLLVLPLLLLFKQAI